MNKRDGSTFIFEIHVKFYTNTIIIIIEEKKKWMRNTVKFIELITNVIIIAICLLILKLAYKINIVNGSLKCIFTANSFSTSICMSQTYFENRLVCDICFLFLVSLLLKNQFFDRKYIRIPAYD